MLHAFAQASHKTACQIPQSHYQQWECWYYQHCQHTRVTRPHARAPLPPLPAYARDKGACESALLSPLRALLSPLCPLPSLPAYVTTREHSRAHERIPGRERWRQLGALRAPPARAPCSSPCHLCVRVRATPPRRRPLLPPLSVTPHLFLSRATRYSLLVPPSHFEPALPPLYLPPLLLLLHPLLVVLVFLLLRGRG